MLGTVLRRLTNITPYAKDGVPLASLVPDIIRYPAQDALVEAKLTEDVDYLVNMDKSFNARVIESESLFKVFNNHQTFLVYMGKRITQHLPRDSGTR